MAGFSFYSGFKRSLFFMIAALAGVSPASAQTAGGSSAVHPLITLAVTNQRTTLPGHVNRKLLADAQDQGAVADALELRLYVVLARSSEQQFELTNLIARQQQPTAAEYHKWLTPRQFGQSFGAAQQDVTTITAWLQSQGLQVDGVMNNGGILSVIGNAGKIRQAFGTQLHNLSLNGSVFPALIQEPSIPAALAPAIVGIQGLNRVPRRMNVVNPRGAAYDATNHKIQEVQGGNTVAPGFASGGLYLVSPRDLYTIYNINKVQSPTGLNVLGATSSVAVIEQSDIAYGTVSASGVATGGDVVTFRSFFGVPGTLNMHVYHGYGTITCNAPGVDPKGIGEDVEASLDAEWANATAPSANLIFMSCDQSRDDGVYSALMAVIDNNLADVVSLSYDQSELYFTAASYSFLDTLWSQAAAQGESIFVCTGDSGSDVRDQNTTGTAIYGINVSGLAASPLVTSTGGTDFSDSFDAGEGGPPQSTYWGATNNAFLNDALSYVPETAWNDSCASSLLARMEGYSGAAFCATNNYVQTSVVAGSGGFSTHYAVPSYQTGTPGYSGTTRAQPDISGFSSNNWFGHALLYCDSRNAYSNCINSIGLAGGTSFVAPYMAGVAGLLDTYIGSRQGLLNPALYALAKKQFTSSATSSACYANGQTSNAGVTVGLPGPQCIFNDVTTGNIDVPCAAGGTSCYVNPGASFGMLSLTGPASLTVAYPSTPGYDEATGLGSVNVYNLITGWQNAFTASVALSANPTIISPGQSTTLTATVTGGTPTGATEAPPAINGVVSFSANSTGLLGFCVLNGGSCNIVVTSSALQAGSNSVTALFQGDPTYPSATSSMQTVTVAGGLQSQSIAFSTIATQTVGAPLTLTATASSGLAVSYSASPSSVCSVSGATAAFSGAGTCSITATQTGNSTYAAATPVTQAFSVVTSTPFTGSPFITSQALGPLRNNYSGLVGFEFSVGGTAIQVSSLGRLIVGGNSASHTVKLVQANGTDLAGGAVTVATAGASAGQFAYAALGSPLTLLAGSTYYLVSQETAGGDYWYDIGPVTSSSIAAVLAPTYTDANNNYVPVSGLAGDSYVPVNFLYGAGTTSSLSVEITSPAAGVTVSGSVSVVVSTSGTVTGLQLQVDGNNQGGLIAVNPGGIYTLSLDTTVLSNASHSLSVIAYGTAGPVTSSAVSISVSNPAGGSTPFVVSQSPVTLRNDYTGFVGMSLTVGSTPVVVTSLGRYVANGNSGSHVVKLANADGTDVAGGSVTVPTSGATPGQFNYASLPAGGVTLQPNTSYFLLSQEVAGGDNWYDIAPVSTSPVAIVTAPVYADGSGHYVPVSGLSGESYVPVSFLYGSTSNNLSVNISSPTSGAVVSGGVQVMVTTKGNVSSLQLQVDGVNQGTPVPAGPITLNTAGLSNGAHSLVVVVSGSGATASSPAVTVTVNNAGITGTAFVTAQTPSTLRNNYSGNVGFAIQVGATPLSVTALGRLAASGNSGTHTLQIVQSNGTPVAGGSVTVSLSGSTAGQYVYGTLSNPVSLAANATYYVVSQETNGGDAWYDLEPVTTTTAGQIAGPTYTDGHGNNVVVGGLPGYSYVPLNFKYQ